MAKNLTTQALIQVLDWTYDKAVNGIPGTDTAEKMAQDYLKGGGSLEDKAGCLIRWQCTKAGVSGFLNGLGGVILMPVTLPANITSVMYVQTRMVAAIAHMGGHDIRDDRVKALVYACLCGNAAKDLVKEAGIKTGTKLGEQAVKAIPYPLIRWINQAVGFRLLTKFGQKGVVNLHKLVPVVGGVVGSTLDSAATRTVGWVAVETFIGQDGFAPA